MWNMTFNEVKANDEQKIENRLKAKNLWNNTNLWKLNVSKNMTNISPTAAQTHT